MNLNPTISVIVPVYNVEKFVSKCIDSILAQTFRDFELILINDGSTDDSLEICKLYKKKDNRVVLISQKNRGVSAARNIGLDNARGKYISFVDSDDFIEKDYLRLLLNNLKENNSDIAMCEYFLTDENGKKYSIEHFNEPQHLDFLSGKMTFSYVYKNNHIPNVVSWNKLYKRSPFVHFYSNYDECKNILHFFEKNKDVTYSLKQRDSFLETNSWENRISKIETLIAEL